MLKRCSLPNYGSDQQKNRIRSRPIIRGYGKYKKFCCCHTGNVRRIWNSVYFERLDELIGSATKSFATKEYISLVERTAAPPLSYKKSTHPTSPRYVCSILHFLSVCITAERAGRERLGESTFCKTMGGGMLAVLRVINIIFLLHS